MNPLYVFSGLFYLFLIFTICQEMVSCRNEIFSVRRSQQNRNCIPRRLGIRIISFCTESLRISFFFSTVNFNSIEKFSQK